MYDYTIGPILFFLCVFVFLGHANCVIKTAMLGDQSVLSYQKKRKKKLGDVGITPD